MDSDTTIILRRTRAQVNEIINHAPYDLPEVHEDRLTKLRAYLDRELDDVTPESNPTIQWDDHATPDHS